MEIDDPVEMVEGEDGVVMDAISYGSKEDALGIGLLGVCGCSDTDTVALVVGDFLRRVAVEKEYAYAYFGRHGIDAENNDVHRALVDVFLGVLARSGIVEHGTSIRCPWLTRKGRSLTKLMGWSGFENMDEQEELWK